MENKRTGDRLRISADLWNAAAEAGKEWSEKRRLGNGLGEGRDDDRPTDVLKVRNLSCVNRDAGEVLEVCDRIIELERRHLWFGGAVPAAQGGCYGVLVDALPNLDIGDLQMSGVVRAFVNVSDGGHRRCGVAAGSTYLQSSDSGPVLIVWKPAGVTGVVECVVSIENPCEEVATTTTTRPPQVPSPCEGTCLWQWNAAGNGWSLQTDGCGVATTTPAPTTAPPPVQPCSCGAATTTTAAPTSTTAPPCDCNWPTYCGQTNGEQTVTYCGPGETYPPDCGTTTTTTTTTTVPTTTTTTTCDCSSTTAAPTTAAPDCATGCDWSYLPTGFGGMGWVLTGGGCSYHCPCPQPTGVGDPCEGQHTACVSTPPPPPTTGPPACSGSCEFWWIPDSSSWYLTANNCNTAVPGCNCYAPSEPGSNCGPVSTPCQSPPTTTSTRPPCEETCYPTTTTTTGSPTTTTSTTAAPCQDCKWEWDATQGTWSMVEDNCNPCPCGYPANDGGAGCETVVAPCGDTTSPPTTTTTTTTTTTATPTTTSEPTTTTTCAPGSGSRTWECKDTPPGCCNGDPVPVSCHPYWVLTAEDCCTPPDLCIAPEAPCDCDHIGDKIVAANCEDAPTTTTTTTPCPDCPDLVAAGTGCHPDTADCCCSYRCNPGVGWVLNETGANCTTCPSAADILVGDPDYFDSCAEGTIGCMDEGVNVRCIYSGCGCTTTSTTTTTMAP